MDQKSLPDSVNKEYYLQNYTFPNQFGYSLIYILAFAPIRLKLFQDNKLTHKLLYHR